MLHETCKAGQQSGEAEADHHAHDRADVRIGFCGVDGGLHRSYSAGGMGVGCPFSSIATMMKVPAVTFSSLS